MITGTPAEYQSDAGSTKDTPYLTLTGELWGVVCEYCWENWPCYNSITLYWDTCPINRDRPNHCWLVNWNPRDQDTSDGINKMLSVCEISRHDWLQCLLNRSMSYLLHIRYILVSFKIFRWRRWHVGLHTRVLVEFCQVQGQRVSSVHRDYTSNRGSEWKIMRSVCIYKQGLVE